VETEAIARTDPFEKQMKIRWTFDIINENSPGMEFQR